MGGELPATATSPTRSAGRSELALAEHDRLGGARPRRRRARRPRPAAAGSAPSTCAETISGSVVSGRPTPMRTRAKSAPPSSAFSDFRPLWPARPPPMRGRMSPNGRSISSCRTSTRSSAQLVGAARRADGAAGLVHVRLRQQHGDARAAGPGPALGQQTRRTSSSRAAGPSARRAGWRPRSRRCAACRRTSRRGCRGRRRASRPVRPLEACRGRAAACVRLLVGRGVAGCSASPAGALADELGLFFDLVLVGGERAAA